MTFFNNITLLSLLSAFSLYGQMDQMIPMQSRASMPNYFPMRQSWEGINHAMQMDDQTTQEQQRRHVENDQQCTQNYTRESNNIQQIHPKGILKYPSVITPNVGSLPWV